MITGLKENELKVLHSILLNKNLSYGEIAKESGITEGSVRRISNRMKQEGIFKEMNVPNFAMLGFKVMILQIVKIASPRAKDIPSIIRKVKDKWHNCVDCHETFDGKIVIRSVWKEPDDFKNSRTQLHQEIGTDWLLQEDIEMIPLETRKEFIMMRSPFKDEHIRSD
ncbi:winged helix-turn-helix transcriptional regulator [Thermoproteota archaeon]